MGSFCASRSLSLFPGYLEMKHDLVPKLEWEEITPSELKQRHWYFYIWNFYCWSLFCPRDSALLQGHWVISWNANGASSPLQRGRGPGWERDSAVNGGDEPDPATAERAVPTPKPQREVSVRAAAADAANASRCKKDDSRTRKMMRFCPWSPW